MDDAEDALGCKADPAPEKVGLGAIKPFNGGLQACI